MADALLGFLELGDVLNGARELGERAGGVAACLMHLKLGVAQLAVRELQTHDPAVELAGAQQTAHRLL